MADQSDVRRIALSLPGVYEAADRFAFLVPTDRGKDRAFLWAWLERVDPKRARVPSAEAIVIRVPDLADKQALLAAQPRQLFTEPHYNGYAAVLVRLAACNPEELREWIADGWRCSARRTVVEDFGAA